MKSNEQTYHLINSYLSGELRGRELDKFKADLRNDEDFKVAFELQKEIIAAIEANRERELKEMLTQGTKHKAIPMFGNRMPLVLGTAAAIALLAVAFFTLPKYFSTNDTESSTELAKESDDRPNEKKDITLIDTGAILKELNADSNSLAKETPLPTVDQTPIVEESLENIEAEEELADMDKSLSEADASTDGIETTSLPKKDIVVDKEETIEGEDEDILKDELIATKTYSVSKVSLDFDKLETEESTEAKRSDVNEKVLENAEYKETPTRNLKVEHWNSVVNFRGYQYDGNSLRLYSIPKETPLNFKELDGRLYVELKGDFYQIEQNKNYKRLIEVTNPTLLKVLNE